MREKIYGFAYLRAIACVAIIVLHVEASIVLIHGGSLKLNQIVICSIIYNLMMWAVPCFVMVTGALLLDAERNITYKKLFERYVGRALGALILFGIIFRVFDIFMDHEAITISNFVYGIYEIFTGTGWSHLWYLYLLIGLYVMLPFYRKIAEYSSQNELKYLLIIYLLFISILPIAQIWNMQSGFYIHVSSIYPFYLFCGYVIHKEIIRIKKSSAVFMVCIGSAGIIVLTYLQLVQGMSGIGGILGYSSILVVMQAVGIYTLFARIASDGQKKTEKVLLNIDKYSFGIYLIHMLFVRSVLRYMDFNPYEHNAVVSSLLIIIGVFLLSYLSSWILQHIPGLKRIM